MTLTRRKALGLVGAVLLGGAAAIAGSETSAQAKETGWRWCIKCEGLWYGTYGRGVCLANPGPGHATEDSGYYSLLAVGEGSGQLGWSRCGKCQGLYFSGPQGNRYGRCAAGGGHSRENSGYLLQYASAGDDRDGQAGWRWCDKCELLWFGARATPRGGGLWYGQEWNQCPADIRGHRYYEHNAEYRLPHLGQS